MMMPLLSIKAPNSARRSISSLLLGGAAPGVLCIKLLSVHTIVFTGDKAARQWRPHREVEIHVRRQAVADDTGQVLPGCPTTCQTRTSCRGPPEPLNGSIPDAFVPLPAPDRLHGAYRGSIGGPDDQAGDNQRRPLPLRLWHQRACPPMHRARPN